MKVYTRYLALAFALLLTCSWLGVAAEPTESQTVQFETGTSSAEINGSIKGYKTIDYKLRARAGQTMSVRLDTDNTGNYFNVLPPGSDDVAIFIGSTSGNEWTGNLLEDGDYNIRVYLMRSAARRNEAATYLLTVGITGSASDTARAKPLMWDAKVKGTPYHATGTVPCSMGDTELGSMHCEFGVIRGGSGSAEVHVTPPGGFERVLIFENGKVTAADEGSNIKVSRSDDFWLIEVNDYEHYRIPDAVISGG